MLFDLARRIQVELQVPCPIQFNLDGGSQICFCVHSYDSALVRALLARISKAIC